MSAYEDDVPAARGARRGAVIVVLNLPVPDDRRVWAQAEALRDDGVAVSVVCPAIRGESPSRVVIDGIEVVYFRSFEGTGKLATIAEGAWTTAASSRAAKSALARMSGSARTLQVCNPPDLLFGLLSWARKNGCATVYDQHDVVPALAGSRPAFAKLRGFFEYCERRTVEAADVILTPSQEQVERLRERYGRAAVLIRTAAVAGGTTTRGSGEVPAGGTGPDTVLGYLGVIGEQDGLGELVDAVRELRERGVSGFRVEIAGDGPALAAARSQASAHCVDDLVTFHGWLGRAEMDKFLDGIDAMLVPDPDLEFNHYCAMNKVTHAMARGLPVVLRPLRENSRLVGEAGYLAKDMSPAAFVDAISELLLAEPGERAALGRRLRTSFDQELSWDAFAPRYLAAVSPFSTR